MDNIRKGTPLSLSCLLTCRNYDCLFYKWLRNLPIALKRPFITRLVYLCLLLGKLKKEAQAHKRSKAKSGCPYHDHTRLQDYKDRILVSIKFELLVHA